MTYIAQIQHISQEGEGEEEKEKERGGERGKEAER